MKKFDLIVIGAGPGGYVAAIKAAKESKSVLCIDKDNMGGICLNWGCIPTKSLLSSAEYYSSLKNSSKYGVDIKDYSFDYNKVIEKSRDVSGNMTGGIEFLFKKNKVSYIKGKANIISSNLVEISKESKEVEQVECQKIIIATGASAVDIDDFKVDGKNIINYRHALDIREKPDKILIIGSGAIGVEFGYFFNSFDTEVHIVEIMDSLLPIEDKDISSALKKEFNKQGINTYLSTKTKSVKVIKDGQINVVLEDKNNKEINIEVNKVLVAVGMRANTKGFGLEKLGVKLDKRGSIEVNEFMQTNIDNVYAIGDVAGKQMLAHKASFEGEVAVNHILGFKKTVNYNQVPGCTYCKPQVASVGFTQKKAEELGYKLKIGKFPFTASGKAQAINHSEGFVKLIFDAKNDGLIGAHIIGHDATEMIAELCLGIKLEATWEEIAEVMHAHPTLSEAIMEASLDADGKAIHI